MAVRSLVPIAFKKEISRGQKAISILAADVGGTKTNIARYRADHEGLTVIEQKRYISKDHPSLSAIIHEFSAGQLPERISAAIAGPVVNGKSKLTNLPSRFPLSTISRRQLMVWRDLAEMSWPRWLPATRRLMGISPSSRLGPDWVRRGCFGTGRVTIPLRRRVGIAILRRGPPRMSRSSFNYSNSLDMSAGSVSSPAWASKISLIAW
jgi:hypothetical protein